MEVGLFRTGDRHCSSFHFFTDTIHGCVFRQTAGNDNVEERGQFQCQFK